MAYLRCDPGGGSSPTASGWDAWADEYASLGATSPGYSLGKRLLHGIVRRVVPSSTDGRCRVLDFNCGAGDDVARFLDQRWQVFGCDGSAGMLRQAALRSAPDLAAGRLELWRGRAEEVTPTSFGSRPFDLVFSAIGGFAYLDDATFIDVHRSLAQMLAPGGAMVLAHLTPFCLSESLYHLSRLSLRAAVKRWPTIVEIEVRGQPLTMHLRSPRRVRRLLAGTVRIEGLLPLLVWTPPFQTGFRPSPRVLSWLEPVEHAMTALAALAPIADQVVCVARRL